ncbi:hypothetical protein F4779DRAFT_639528 [Xylariaceae sp. FL0662B]|nr:hypothetical protein F4779DRAFT_639528 [Xylariaceae sp. FL0662B]
MAPRRTPRTTRRRPPPPSPPPPKHPHPHPQRSSLRRAVRESLRYVPFGAPPAPTPTVSPDAASSALARKRDARSSPASTASLGAAPGISTSSSSSRRPGPRNGGGGGGGRFVVGWGSRGGRREGRALHADADVDAGISATAKADTAVGGNAHADAGKGGGGGGGGNANGHPRRPQGLVPRPGDRGPGARAGARTVYLVEWEGRDPRTGRPWPGSWVNARDVSASAIREWEEKQQRVRDRSTVV